MTTFEFELRDAGDPSVGIWPVREHVSITLKTDWEIEDGELEHDLKEALAAVFDMQCLTKQEVEAEEKRMKEWESKYGADT